MDRIEQFIRVEEDGGNTASVQTVASPKVASSKPPARFSLLAKASLSPSNFVVPFLFYFYFFKIMVALLFIFFRK